MLIDDSMNEDLFFSMGKSNTFKVAPVDIALGFAFEQEIERCFHQNSEKIPFGCHAWERYHFAFWKPYIEQFGYEVELPNNHDGEDDKKMTEYHEECRTYARFMEYEYHKEELSVFLKSIFGEEYEPVSVWGAGAYGRQLCALLQDAGIEIDYILDNNPEKQNRIIYNYRVLSLDSYRKKKKRVSIIIAIKKHCREVAAQLEKCGYRYKKEYIFYHDIRCVFMKNRGIQEKIVSNIK